MESSLTSCQVPLFSFPFCEILPIQAPLFQTSTWLLTQPRLALSQESSSRPCARGFSCPGPRACPRDLIVLKHSSYRLIFQCPLSLVSDLHICWSTVGCSLCSSDQLGVSLALRGSGFCCYLSRRHLLIRNFTFDRTVLLLGKSVNTKGSLWKGQRRFSV